MAGELVEEEAAGLVGLDPGGRLVRTACTGREWGAGSGLVSVDEHVESSGPRVGGDLFAEAE